MKNPPLKIKKMIESHEQLGLLDFDPDLTEDPSVIENPTNKTILGKLWKNREGIGMGIGYGINAGASYNREYNQDRDYENAFRNRMQQDPILDYMNSYGDNQPLIKAGNGAKVRTGGSKVMPVEIEGGEFMVLPDGTTEIGKGSKHTKGGISTILPNNTLIYSDKLKPVDSKKSFAELAKKHDYTHELEVINNPYASDVAKNTANKMLPRKQKRLAELFQKQQLLNNNSSGEYFEEGGEYDFVRNQSVKPTTNFEKRMYHTPRIDNKDGSMSSHKMMSWSDDQGHYAAPTIVEKNSKLEELTPDEAIAHAYSTGEYKSFKTFEEANAYANNGYKKGTPMETFIDRNEEYKGYKKGGKVKYEEGGVYDVDEREIERLKKLGYKIELL